MTAAPDTYLVRMQRVLDHIDRHLDGTLDLETISGVAAFSKFHFHRLFAAIFGLSVHRYVQLARMKRASYQLAFRNSQSIMDVALDPVTTRRTPLPAPFGKGWGNRPRHFARPRTGSRGFRPSHPSTLPGASSCRLSSARTM